MYTIKTIKLAINLTFAKLVNNDKIAKGKIHFILHKWNEIQTF